MLVEVRLHQIITACLLPTICIVFITPRKMALFYLILSQVDISGCLMLVSYVLIRIQVIKWLYMPFLDH